MIGRNMIAFIVSVAAMALTLSFPDSSFSERKNDFLIALVVESPAESKIMVKDFKITGNEAISDDVILARLQKYMNKEHTLDELKIVANIVTLIYQEQGYMLARAYIPEQEISYGVAEIVVAEGTLGNVEVSDTRYYSKSYIRGYFDRLKGKAVKEEDIERAILLANNKQSLNVTTTFNRGKKRGTSDLFVDVEDNYPINVDFEFNNHGNPGISRERYTLVIEATDAEWGSELSLRGITGNALDDTFYGGVDYRIPLNQQGTMLGARYVNADYVVGGDLSILGIEGDANIVGGYLAHPFTFSKDENLWMNIGFDYKDMNEFILGFPKSNDKLSIGYLRFDYESLDRFLGKNYMSFQYAHGFEKTFGSLDAIDENASRFDSGGRFDKFNLDFARIQSLPKRIALIIRASGQFSYDRLVTPEEFSLGGAGSVRGHALSSFLGDHGYYTSLELSSPLPFSESVMLGNQSLAEIFRAAVFFDHGGIFNEHPALAEEVDEYLSSAGVGARLFLFDRLTAKLDVGYPIRDGDLETENEIVYIQAIVKIVKF